MNTINLTTKIQAPIEVVFDLSRSIDFHLQSASQTQETAIAGKTTGLIGYGETVSWRGKHLGVFLKHTSKIVNYQRPSLFTDVMIKGHFKYFAHQHLFEVKNSHVLMTDILKYKVPFGFFGKMFDRLILSKHLIKFLSHRNSMIKISAEKTS